MRHSRYQGAIVKDDAILPIRHTEYQYSANRVSTNRAYSEALLVDTET